jgi:hypothetical protein
MLLIGNACMTGSPETSPNRHRRRAKGVQLRALQTDGKVPPLAGLDQWCCLPASPQQTALEMVSLDGQFKIASQDRGGDRFSPSMTGLPGFVPDNGRPARSTRCSRRCSLAPCSVRWNVARRSSQRRLLVLGLKLTDPVFDASTLSRNWRRRYNDTTVAWVIFDEIVELACRGGWVTGQVLYTDSTHLKANANKNRYDTAVIAKSRADYWDALDAAIEEDREAHGKKPLPDRERQPTEKETKVSRTDSDAGYMVREGKPNPKEPKDPGHIELVSMTIKPGEEMIVGQRLRAILGAAPKKAA